MLLLLIFFVLVIYPFNMWFLKDTILTYGDWMYFFSETQKEMLSLPTFWSQYGLGQMNLGLTMYPVMLGWGVLTGLGFGISERLLIMIPSIVCAYWGSYLLLQLYFKNKYAIAIGVLTYTLNTYFMAGRTGHLTLMVGFAIAPLIFYFFHKFLNTKKSTYFVFSLLGSIIVGYYEFRAFYLIATVVGLIGLFAWIIEKSISLKNILFVFSVYFGLIFLANLFWLLPFQMTNFFITNEITGRTLFGNGFMRIDRALGLFHPFWSGGKIIPFEVQKMPIVMWILPITSIAGLFYFKKKPIVLLYGLIAIIGIFLTKQSNQPFSGVYEWLYNNFPGFGAFREASKFYFLIALGYTFLITACIEGLMSQKQSSIFIERGKYIVPIVIGIIFLWNTKPIITGEVGTLFTPRSIPEDYTKLRERILTHDEFYRTLWIPRSSRWAFYTNRHPLISVIDTKLTCPNEDICIDILGNNISNEILDLYSIKYVIVPLQDFENDDDFFQFYGHSRQYYIDQLARLDYLSKTDIGIQELAIFENTNYKPLIYISNENIQSEVSADQISTSQYHTQLIVQEDQQVLHLTNSYHPDWKLRIGDFNWLDSITKKDYFYPEKYHSKSEVDLNEWTIDVNWLKKNGYDFGDAITVTIYFAPQAYVMLGGIISFSALFLIIAFLLITLAYEHKKKNN